MTAAPTILPLRDYQRAALDAVVDAEREGVTRQMVVLPTGAGKTILAAHAVREIAQPRGWTTVMLVHRDELVRQSVVKLADINPALSVGVVKAEQNDAHAAMIVASAQTLARKSRLEALVRSLSRPVLLIDDECHHSRAETRQRAIAALAPALLLGITATPERGDGKGLGQVYNRIVYQMGMLDLMRRGKLAQLVGVRVGTDVSLDSVRTTAGEFNEHDLEVAVDSPERNRLIVRAWQEHAADRTHTVVFCVTVDHALHVAAAFRDAGVRAETIFGHTPAEERQRTLRDFAAGQIPVLVNVMVLTEGYDEPLIDCIVMARPTQSRGLFVQCVGRGARPHAAKPNCLVLDVVDVSARHKLAGLATLTDEDQEAEDADPDLPLNRPFDLLDTVDSHRQERTAKLARHTEIVNLFGASPWLWREVAGRYMTPAKPGVWIVLDPERASGPYWPCLLRDSHSDCTLVPMFDRALTLDYAMGAAEAKAAEYGYAPNTLYGKGAGWRTRAEPATPGQVGFARSLRLKLSGTETKAQLSERIDDALFTRAYRRAALVWAARPEPRKDRV